MKPFKIEKMKSIIRLYLTFGFLNLPISHLAFLISNLTFGFPNLPTSHFDFLIFQSHIWLS